DGGPVCEAAAVSRLPRLHDLRGVTPRLTHVTHPLVQHKLSYLREKSTPTVHFRKLVDELTLLLTYEATKDFPIEEVEVQTPLERGSDLGGEEGRRAQRDSGLHRRRARGDRARSQRISRRTHRLRLDRPRAERAGLHRPGPRRCRRPALRHEVVLVTA